MFGNNSYDLTWLLVLALFSQGQGKKRSLHDDTFQVYWNVPTFMCKPFGVLFKNLDEYGIIQNRNDNFKGEEILILYDPGLFPSLTDDGKVLKNRGVPQMGDLDKHLQSMRKLIDKVVPNQQFQGLGVLDFESWRPIWKQNWGSLLPYREYSRNIEKKNHPFWSKDQIEDEAERRFESSGRKFMEDTLELVRQMRPNGIWGYYAFPYCFNYTPKNMQPDCPTQTKIDNNNVQWLFDESVALYPSVYLSKRKLNEDQRRQFVEGRLNEAARVARRSKKMAKPSMYPYIWYRYYDDNDFLTKNDLYNSLSISKKYRMGGAIIWGSSNDLNTKEKCEKFSQYVDNELGPIIKSLSTQISKNKMLFPNNIDLYDFNETDNALYTSEPIYDAILID